MTRRLVLPALMALLFADAAMAAPAPVPRVATGAVPTLADATPDKNGIRRMTILRGLDKITGRAIDVGAPSGVPVRFGSLTITARYCYTVPPEEPPETTAFLQIDDGKPGEKPVRMFSGWMFASTPALNALEHPVYDVWVITCKTDQPAEAPPPAPIVPPALPAGAEAPNAPSGALPEPALPGLPRR